MDSENAPCLINANGYDSSFMKKLEAMNEQQLLHASGGGREEQALFPSYQVEARQFGKGREQRFGQRCAQQC